MSETLNSELALVFSLDERLFALPLSNVVQVLRAVEVTPLPQAPAVICGVVNVRGEVIPVVNLRQRLGLPEKALALGDQLLVAQGRRRRLGLLVDGSVGVSECRAPDFMPIEALIPGTSCLAGILKSAQGMILVHDLDALLSLDEADTLNDAMSDV